jgi:nucleotidyltransferase substrate binding protein (TIGR01987 family)
MLDISNFEKALDNLDLQYANWKRLPGRQGLLPLDMEAIEESVVQRFEYTYDTAWKALKHYMSEVIGLPDLPNSPKPIFRIAGENDCLAAPVENWIDYANARVGTSHDYSNQKEDDVLTLSGRFIPDARALLANMKSGM